MDQHSLAHELVEWLRQDDEASAYNVADRIARDRDLAVVTLLQLAADVARSPRMPDR
jgi:hypothetical protein